MINEFSFTNSQKVVECAITFRVLPHPLENVRFLSQSKRFLFYPSGVAVRAHMADDDVLVQCTLHEKKERDDCQRLTHKTRWVG